MDVGCRSSVLKSKNPSRLSALQELKDAKRRGEKHKYKPKADGESLFEEIDEDEYSERVRRIQEEGFVVGGEGTGYVDDGRDLLDEDYDSEDEDQSGSSCGRKSKHSNSERRPKSKDLKSFFGASSSKKPNDENYSVSGDDVLQSILGELQKADDSSVETGSEKTAVPPGGDGRLSDKSCFRGTELFAGSSNAHVNIFEGIFDRKRQSSSSPPPPKDEANGIRRSTVSDLPAAKLACTLSSAKSTLVSASLSSRETNAEKAGALFENFDVDSQASFTCEKPSDVPFDADLESELQVIPETQSEINTEASRFDFSGSGASATKDSSCPQDREVDALTATFLSPTRLTKPCEAPTPDTSVEASQICDVTQQFDSSINGAVDSMILESSAKLKFYYMDSYEDAQKNPGVVYLFGKVKANRESRWISCCVAVRDIERLIWVLPRQRNVRTDTPVNFQMVYDEVRVLMDRMKVREFRVKKVRKKFWRLEENSEIEDEYLELRYPFSSGSVSPDTSGDTFSKIYGFSYTAQEIFLLENSIKGPRFLEITEPAMGHSTRSLCALECNTTMVNVQPLQETALPPLCVMCINVKTVRNAKSNQDEVVAVAFWVNRAAPLDSQQADAADGWRKSCIMTKTNDCQFPFDFRAKLEKDISTAVEIVPNERSLLNCFLMKIRKFDPDIVIGHDLVSYEIPNLLQRMRSNKVVNWFCFSRLKNAGQIPPSFHSKSMIHEVTAGRLYCDTKIMAKEFVHAKGYTLQQIASQVLSVKEWNVVDVKESYKTSNALLSMMEQMVYEAQILYCVCVRIACLPLTAEITRIVGGVWSRTLLGGRSERSAFLLLHAFHSQNFISPDKPSTRKGKWNEDGEAEEGFSARKKAAYSGGLVLDPKKGLYDRIILLLDFNSLYPSIIQEYNICFTTVPLHRAAGEASKEDEEIPDTSSISTEPGILPVEIRKLVQSRRQVKRLMAANDVPSDLMQQYNIRQQALKITANSMYGCLGFGASRFYAKPLAALVTAKGREILMDTKDLVEKLGFDVIYGDTDSLMINSNQNDLEVALNLGKKIKQEVNKRYKLLELDIDGLYKKLLLLKKKKYAALAAFRMPDGAWAERKEVKGLDIVRRDWSGVAIDAGNFILDLIMSDDVLDDVLCKIFAYLSGLATDIREDKLPLEKYEIYKQLTRRPQDYADPKSQPHVVVALRMNSKGHHFQAGDIVKYIICGDSTNNPATQRAYYRSEFDTMPELKIDVNYYLSQQVYPVVSRLCDPVEGASAFQIADCLGIQTSSYRQPSSGSEDILYSPGLDYSNCLPFAYECPGPTCVGKEYTVSSVFIPGKARPTLALENCPNPDCTFLPADMEPVLSNYVKQQIQACVCRYYEGWLSCDDFACNYRCRALAPAHDAKGRPYCPKCKHGILVREYSHRDMHLQLCFYNHLFDVDAAISQLDRKDIAAAHFPASCLRLYATLNVIVNAHLEHCRYGQVNIKEMYKLLI